MSEYALIQKDSLTAIADVIREETKSAKLYTLNEMIDEIKPIQESEEMKQKIISLIERNCTSFQVPEGITIIENNAFEGSTSLANITFPESLTSIAPEAFLGSGLTNITFPKNLATIDTRAFGSCENLTTVTFNGKPNFINSTAFSANIGHEPSFIINVPWSEGEVEGAPWGATNATINYNCVNTMEDIMDLENEDIEYDVLINKNFLQIIANKLRQHLKNNTSLHINQIPHKIKEVLELNYKEQCAFIDRTVNNYNIPNGVAEIGERAFANWTSLEGITIPEGVTAIKASAFANAQFENITFPESLTSIGGAAFWGSGLTNITFSKNLATIDNNAFYDNWKLSSVTFKGKPSSIGENVFPYCKNLTTINVPWSEGEVEGAPWGAEYATINYNYTGE